MLNPYRSEWAYSDFLRRHRRLDPEKCPQRLRVAILSDSAVQPLVPVLEVAMAERGVWPQVYEGGYDAIEIEALDAHSGLYAFQPEAVILLSSTNALRRRYYRSADRRTFASETIEMHERIWDALERHSTAVVVQSNYVLPYERRFGNFDHKVADTLHRTVAGLNVRIAEQAERRTRVLINDVEALASYVGRMQWCDERLWTLSKAFCAYDYLPLLARNTADILLANNGRVVKCIVLDLDNTLWGGVVGDDGLEGIEIGELGEGEPFQHFQHYLRELKRRGIALAVCSKNDESIALEPFRRHADMVLKEEDIAVFVANWNPKPDNIRVIRETLAIGFDSMVFLDDNPFERQLVRESLPEVIVPELPDDPSEYVRALSELNLFEVTAFSKEDEERADFYRSNWQRRTLESSASDISSYLSSLEMRIRMARFDDFHLPRIVQLLQRSNQFNLTTRRYGMAECERLMRDTARYEPLYVRLADRFGDNGLISVIILELHPAEILIDSWLMSCRVLGRGVEQYAMNRIVAWGRQRGYESINGVYLPTAKNGMVRDFYGRFGFERVADLDGGGTRWHLQLASYEPRPTYMSAEEEYGSERAQASADGNLS